MEGKTFTSSQQLFTDLSSKTLLSLGDSYYVDENYEEAVEAYAAALALFRDSEVVLQVRTLSHRSSSFYKLQRYQEALDDAEKSLELLSTKKPSGLRTGEGEICHFRVGLAAFELKQYLKAKNILQNAAELALLNKSCVKKEVYDNLLEKCNNKLSTSEPPSVLKKSTNIEKDDSILLEGSLQGNAIVPTDSSENVIATRSTLAGSKNETPKYQYYQSDKVMTISIPEAGVRRQDLTVRFQSKHLLIILRKNGVDFTIIAGNLHAEIDVEKSKVVLKEEKVLVKLRKTEHYEWSELMGKEDYFDTSRKSEKKDISKENKKSKDLPAVLKGLDKPRPYASHRDWDAIEKDIVEEGKNEKAEGDEAMNKLFKQIYSNASDDTRRAMVKSFQTSGGTVLSTNWDEVKNKDYEKQRTAPKGVEWKRWDGE